MWYSMHQSSGYTGYQGSISAKAILYKVSTEESKTLKMMINNDNLNQGNFKIFILAGSFFVCVSMQMTLVQLLYKCNDVNVFSYYR